MGDPTRDITLLFPTLFSNIGSLSDTFKILRLTNILKRKTVAEIFEATEKTTLSYVKDFGFSLKLIDDFFKPFFSGIFLEPHLNTSSRMFEFIFKMLAEGYAVLPKAGIGAISEQLVNNLSRTTFKFNTKVEAVRDGEIQLNNGETLQSDYTIVTVEASNLIENIKQQPLAWRSCDTLYFKTTKRIIKKPLIGLIPDSKALINNIYFNTSFETVKKSEKGLLSVTIVKEHLLSDDELILRVQKELKTFCGIDSLTFLKKSQLSESHIKKVT